MPRKLAIRNPEKIACQIRSLVFETARTRFQVRLHTVLLIACGMPVPELAKIYGIAPTTIHRWIHRLNRQGITGLKERSGRGRKSCLSSRDRRRLCLDLNTSPRLLGYGDTRWSGRLLGRHLKEEYGIQLRIRQCQNLLQRFYTGDLW